MQNKPARLFLATLLIKSLPRILGVFSLAALPFCLATATTDPALPRMRASIGALPSASPIPPVILQKKNISALPTLKKHSNVFCVTDEQALRRHFVINEAIVRTMLAELICAVANKKTSTEAWQSLIKTGPQGDMIGIKITTESGLLAGTHYELIQALVEELKAAGVLPEKIVVWDRRNQDLKTAGYLSESAFRVEWMEHGSGYDPKQLFFSPVSGRLVYGDLSFQETPHSVQELLSQSQYQLSNESHYASLLTRIDKIINVPSLCDNSYCGINGALVSMSLGVIDNWRRFIKPPYVGDPYIPELYATEQIKKKVILTIMDALALQYAGGPTATPAYTVSYNTLLASYDPVALDATALRLLNEERLLKKFPAIDTLASHITKAEELGLGHASEKEIELISPRGKQKHELRRHLEIQE